MKIVILGAGPAGLYCGLLIKKANPAHDITIIERNPADVTYGWGVVFSDRTLASFQRADYKTYEQITGRFVIWDAIDVHYREEIMRCGGHVIASISRKHLLNILQKRCHELGINLKFGCEINDLAELNGPGGYDVLIAADGLNSIVRKTYAAYFKPELELGKAKYIWLGADKVLDAFTFIFRENEHGLFQVHAYPFSGTTSTFIVECDEDSWLKAGLDRADETESLAYCQHLLAEDLEGATLLSNNSKWINFPTLKTKNWHFQNMVLLGDAVHTAHFSIGSGTKLAMEDAIALASALEQHSNLETALNAYELERKPVVEIFQNAAQVSQAYFETIKRYLGLDPMQFSFQLLTRSGRVTYDDLRLRDTRFGDMVNRWYSQKYSGNSAIFAPPPMFAPLKLRSLTLPNRLVLSQHVEAEPASALHTTHRETLPDHGMPCRDHLSQLAQRALSGAGLLMTGPIAVSVDGRITPTDAGMYTQQHAEAWAETIEGIHGSSAAKIGIELNHAGRRGATRPRSQGIDKPLKEDGWPLISASPLPYTPRDLVPKEMDRSDMEQVLSDFVRAARWADDADFDLLQLNFAHGYLLASFISPLTNLRCDEYGGNLEQRMRFPLEVCDAVRTAWPEKKPISVAISASDYARGGFTIEDAVITVRLLKERGCDILEVRAGQTTIDSEPAYGRGFLTPLSEQVRNEASIATMVGGYLTTSNEVDTILAAGRADLCITDPPHLDKRYWTTPAPATKLRTSLRN
ncbi:MAG: bifunctional salicylyl-CoA 5-hydroxylase/oxidoreductase [Ktedonobacteraceae bacterium]